MHVYYGNEILSLSVLPGEVLVILDMLERVNNVAPEYLDMKEEKYKYLAEKVKPKTWCDSCVTSVIKRYSKEYGTR